MHATLTLAGLVTEITDPTGQAKDHPLLFIHGMWEGASVWRNYLSFFSEHGYQCYAPYLRGYHPEDVMTDAERGKVSVDEYLDDVRGAINDISSNSGKLPILIGHSFGGLLAQKLATEFDLPKVVVLATAAPRGVFALGTPVLRRTAWRHRREILGGLPLMLSFEEMSDLLLNGLPTQAEEKSERTRERVYQKMLPASGLQTRQIVFPGVEVSAPEVRCKMLIIGAKKDQITPEVTVKKVHEKYSQIAEYLSHPGAHMVMMEDGGELLASEIARWLELPPLFAYRKRPISSTQ